MHLFSPTVLDSQPKNQVDSISRMHFFTIVVLALSGAIAVSRVGIAQRDPEGDQENTDAETRFLDLENALPFSAIEDDPLGLDPSDADLGKSLIEGFDEKGRLKIDDTSLFGPFPPSYNARIGEVVTAVPAMRETAHRIKVNFDHGLATVQVDLHFTSASKKPAEVRYRLAVPKDAGLGSLKVCNPNGCRAGIVDRPPELSLYDDALLARGPIPVLPIAHASFQQDPRGSAIIVRAAPIAKGVELTVHISYLVETSYHDGVTRLHLPARGMDPRAAASVLETTTFSDNTVLEGASLMRDAWVPVEIKLKLPRKKELSAYVWRFGCAKQRCTRVRVSAAPQPKASFQELLLFIDASPSMIGPARSRIASALAVLLANVPSGTRVSALAFAARVKHVIESPVTVQEVSLEPLINAAIGSELGSATRVESAWKLVKPRLMKLSRSKTGRRTIIIIGDGGLTEPNGVNPFIEAKRAGVEISLLNLSDRKVVPFLQEGVAMTSGIVVSAGEEADRVSRGFGTELLQSGLRHCSLQLLRQGYSFA